MRPLPTEVPEQVMTTELLDQFGETDFYEADEGWTMGEGGY